MNIPDLVKVIEAIRQFPQKKEAFLRVPVNVTEQILKSLGVREQRNKPYKAQTAEHHMKGIDKAAATLSEPPDARVVEFVSAQQMNRACFPRPPVWPARWRSSTRRSGGAPEQRLRLPRRVHPLPAVRPGRALIGSLRCSVCWTILRRCYDCGNYDRHFEKCGATGAPVYVSEAENPRTIRSPISARTTSPSSRPRRSSSRWPRKQSNRDGRRRGRPEQPPPFCLSPDPGRDQRQQPDRLSDRL